MTTLLKRLSMNIERRGVSGRDDGSQQRTLASSTSFSDFSMHVAQDVDDHHSTDRPCTAGAPHAACVSLQAPDIRATPFVVGSAPAGSGFGGLSKTAALKIPRSSVAHLLTQRSMGPAASEGGTPRSSLDVPAGSAPTPRASLSTAASASRTPRASFEEPSSPRSPRSPTTPGGRRRKSQKIDGLDYYEFCELIRSSSL